MDTEKVRDAMLTAFAYLNKDQRTAMRKFLKLSQPKLDFNYPNGVPVEKSVEKS